MWMKILDDLYLRVWVAKKSSLLGLGLLVADVVIQNLLTMNNPTVHLIASILSTLLVLYKGKLTQEQAVKPDLPTGTMLLLLLGALAFASPARAQEAAPLTLQLSPDYSLHLNIGVGALAYDLTQKTFLGKINIAGLYVLDYKGIVGLGGGMTFMSGPTPGATIDALLAGPTLKFANGAARVGLIYQYQWLGAAHDHMIGLVPTLQF